MAQYVTASRTDSAGVTIAQYPNPQPLTAIRPSLSTTKDVAPPNSVLDRKDLVRQLSAVPPTAINRCEIIVIGTEHGIELITMVFQAYVEIPIVTYSHDVQVIHSMLVKEFLEQSERIDVPTFHGLIFRAGDNQFMMYDNLNGTLRMCITKALADLERLSELVGQHNDLAIVIANNNSGRVKCRHAVQMGGVLPLVH